MNELLLRELRAPVMRGPEPAIVRENAERALRYALWLALEAADRCGDVETSDGLLLLYSDVAKRAAR
jgi:hypothetical protein